VQKAPEAIPVDVMPFSFAFQIYSNLKPGKKTHLVQQRGGQVGGRQLQVQQQVPQRRAQLLRLLRQRRQRFEQTSAFSSEKSVT